MIQRQDISTMMVYMDALFDTRLSQLFELNPDSVISAIEGNYLYRDEEVFNGVDKSVYFEKYHSRTKSLMKNATITPIIDMMKQFVKETLVNSVAGPNPVRPRLIVNTYPYVFSNEECNLVKASVMEYIKGTAEVDVIYKSYEDLTPTYLRQEVSVVVMYDYYQWLEVHSVSKRFEKDRCPEVTLIAPGIYFKGKPTRQQTEQAKELGMTPLGIVEVHAGPIIDLKLVNIDVFCAKYLKRPTRNN